MTRLVDAALDARSEDSPADLWIRDPNEFGYGEHDAGLDAGCGQGGLQSGDACRVCTLYEMQGTILWPGVRNQLGWTIRACRTWLDGHVPSHVERRVEQGRRISGIGRWVTHFSSAQFLRIKESPPQVQPSPRARRWRVGPGVGRPGGRGSEQKWVPYPTATQSSLFGQLNAARHRREDYWSRVWLSEPPLRGLPVLRSPEARTHEAATSVVSASAEASHRRSEAA